MADHLVTGQTAEILALHYLQSHKLSLVASNWQYHGGELDLIMLDKQTLVFIEVRYRKQDQWGNAVETITASKRQKLIKTALLFLQKNSQFANKPCRFDVIAMTGELNNPTITWLPNAFSLT